MDEEGFEGGAEWGRFGRRVARRMARAQRRGVFRGFSPGPFGPPWMQRTRAGRGDVRTAILTLLAEEPMHGYQLIQKMSERTDGMWQPSAGSIYPNLQMLEDEGLIAAEESGGKRVYRLTEAGQAELEKRGGRSGAPWDTFNEAEPMRELRQVGLGVLGAVMQVAQAGNSRQLAQAREILAETRRSLYRLLAEDDATAAPSQK
jgi:DNA-binding PadR family transcriptional regulator